MSMVAWTIRPKKTAGARALPPRTAMYNCSVAQSRVSWEPGKLTNEEMVHEFSRGFWREDFRCSFILAMFFSYGCVALKRVKTYVPEQSVPGEQAESPDTEAIGPRWAEGCPHWKGQQSKTIVQADRDLDSRLNQTPPRLSSSLEQHQTPSSSTERWCGT